MDSHGSSGSASSDHHKSSSSYHGDAARLKVNLQIMTYYAISLAILMAIFILGHWVRHLALGLSRFKIFYPIAGLSRVVRRICLRTLPGFASTGHAIVVIIYVALNGLFSFYRIDYSKLSNVSARLGWMAAGNMTLVVFLALRNTPLAILSAYSYERLRSLHKTAGYTTMIDVILHSSTYSYYYIHSDKTEKLREPKVKAGIIVGFSMLTLVATAMFLRRRNYELFYVIHVTLFTTIVTALGLHRPELEKDRLLIVVILIALMWLSDRLIRFVRLAYHSINNEATVYPLPNGGTRIVLKKPISRARPGKHCYIWLPHIRAFETHPFTIVATEPMELVINKCSGFTKDLHDYACANPDGKLKASIDGPYGTFPDPSKYNKVLLVAGGSGATFALGLMANTLQELAPESKRQIDIIWVARDRDNISWFTRYLKDMLAHEAAHKILLKLHLTRFTRDSTASKAPFRKSSPVSTISENGSSLLPGAPMPLTKDLELDTLGREGGSMDKTSVAVDGLNLPVVYGRPDLEASIREAIASTSPDGRVLVAACGPTGLVEAVRDTTAKCIRVDGPAVELHCEQFSW
ncbi:ferric reductase NAD binding domain-containing protein [Xylaria intraflava]|nr:ferric reductase NAD binding domain-containing protein [Xylaria intraflava]